MAEPGKLFLPYRSPTNPKVLFVFELYRSEEGRAAHEKAELLQGVHRYDAAAVATRRLVLCSFRAELLIRSMASLTGAVTAFDTMCPPTGPKMGGMME
jgi:hypothetical protein